MIALKIVSLIFFLIFVVLPKAALAIGDDATEGRIAEHSVFSLVAFSGLLLISYLIRNKRKIDQST